MKKSVKKGNRTSVYDTEGATEIKTVNHGTWGDPAGYSETLYQGKNKLYFIYGIGGAESPYPEEDIKPIAAKDAKVW
ncbi:MAG: hypothetical protein UHI81_10080 [Olegusella sp.]|jgi:hypothetical protein|nr:hypothetical protein [Olegusella sp.]